MWVLAFPLTKQFHFRPWGGVANGALKMSYIQIIVISSGNQTPMYPLVFYVIDSRTEWAMASVAMLIFWRATSAVLRFTNDLLVQPGVSMLLTSHMWQVSLPHCPSDIWSPWQWLKKQHPPTIARCDWVFLLISTSTIILSDWWFVFC